MSLTKKVKLLEEKILALETKMYNISNEVESKIVQPYSKVGSTVAPSMISPINFGSSWSGIYGGGIIWNDAIAHRPSLLVNPPNATIGYNCHGHGRYSGGALDINTVEFVEYNVDWNTEINYNKDCQDWWVNRNNLTSLGFTPPIAKAQKTNGVDVEKVGKLALFFNANTQQWGVATYEIDVEKCYLVKRRSEANKDEFGNPIIGEDVGDVEKDAKGNEMFAPLYSTDQNKTVIVWDANAKCWRFYAVYKD